MTNFEIKHIEHYELEDFLELELNKFLYNDFHEVFKPYIKEDALTFFKYIYSDAVFFFSKYNKTSYEVNDYFDTKYSNEGKDIGLIIKREITFEIVRIAVTNFNWSAGSEEYVAFEPDSFISGRNFSFFHKNHFNHNDQIEGHYHISDFINARCEYRKEDKFYNNFDHVNAMKLFLNSIDISELSKIELPEISSKSVVYFPKSFRLVQEVAKLGLEKTKQLYQANNLKALTNEVFQKEYRGYIEREGYFPGCPFSIYKKTYQKRLKGYLSIYPDADEFDFLKEEEATLTQLIDMRIENKNNFYPFYNTLFNRPHQKNLNMSAEKTREFIDNKIEYLGHGFKVDYQNFHPFHFPDPLDIPDLPREYWKPERNPNVESVVETYPESQPEPHVDFPEPSKIKEKENIVIPASFGFPEDVANIIADAFISYEIVDENKTSKITIIEALTLNWTEIKDKVHLKETTEFVAFLDLVKGNSLYETLSRKQIEQSKIFTTPQDKVLKDSNIRSSKKASKGRGTFEEKERKMQKIIDEISKKISLLNK